MSGNTMNIRERIAIAAERTHRKPTEAQKVAGNYPKGSFWWNGREISIENPRGSVRSGMSSDGRRWAVQMPCHYGYIRRTVSAADGDAVDVMIGPHPESDLVCVVDQQKPGGRFDEHKAVLGCRNVDEARRLYLACYSAGWTGLKSITPMTRHQFFEWLKSGDTGKPIDRQVSKYAKPADDQPRDDKGRFTSDGEASEPTDHTSTADHTAHSSHVLKTARDISSGWDNGALVSARELRKHSKLSKADFDQAVYELAKSRQVMAHKHDFATSLPPDELAELIDTANGDPERAKIHANDGRYWVGVAKRRGESGAGTGAVAGNKYSRLQMAVARYSASSAFSIPASPSHPLDSQCSIGR